MDNSAPSRSLLDYTLDDPWDAVAKEAVSKSDYKSRRGVAMLSFSVPLLFPKFDARYKARDDLQWRHTASWILPNVLNCERCRDLTSNVLTLPMGELAQSANNCAICDVLYRALQEYRLLWNDDARSYTVDICPQKDSPLKVVVDTARLEKDNPKTVMVIELFNGGIYVEWPWRGFGTGQCISKDKINEDLLKTWLERCQSSHEVCEKVRTNNIGRPTRLLYLEPLAHDPANYKIRLIETVEAFAKNPCYVTLSHCWGRHQIIRTTRETYQTRLNDIPVEALSRTFQEAIGMAWAIGFKFIWIDSLCIIQDDKDDWAIEASKMADIYENGDLNLVASSAIDGSEGLFYRQPAKHHTIAVRLPGLADSCHPEKIFVRRVVDHSRWDFNKKGQMVLLYNGIEANPATKRAWIFQETLHCRRSVYFTPREMIFDCRHGVFCECGNISQRPRIMETGQDYMTLFKYDKKKSINTWHEWVGAYTEKQLTYGSDRLVAMSSTMKRLFQKPERYVAGLPREDLLKFLLWAREDREVLPQPRPPYIAPSWSWFSIDDTVEMSIAYNDYNEPFPAIRTGLLSPTKLVAVKVTPSSNDPWGALKGGHIELRTPIARVSIKKEGPNVILIRRKGQKGGKTHIIETDRVVLDVDTTSGDDKLDTGDSAAMAFLETKQDRCLYALVLRPSGVRDDWWVRVGIAYELSQDWWDDGWLKASDITIV